MPWYEHLHTHTRTREHLLLYLIIFSLLSLQEERLLRMKVRVIMSENDRDKRTKLKRRKNYYRNISYTSYRRLSHKGSMSHPLSLFRVDSVSRVDSAPARRVQAIITHDCGIFLEGSLTVEAKKKQRTLMAYTSAASTLSIKQWNARTTTF